MKLKKGALIAILSLLTIIIVSLFSNVKAVVVPDSLTLNIKFLRQSGYGYLLSSTGQGKKVWKIYDKNNDNGKTIYCLKGGPGFGSSDIFTSTPQDETYTKHFDLKQPSTITEAYKTALPTIDSTNYKALLWVLDNCYVPPVTGASEEEQARAEENKKLLLKNAEDYVIEKGTPRINEGDLEELLNDDDIDVVQQLAIWYFTNTSGEYHINNNNFELYLNSVQNTDGNYKALSGRDNGTSEYFENGEDRMHSCQALFKYLTEKAKEAADTYNYANNSEEVPVTLEKTNATVVETKNGRTIVGPYKINSLRTDIEYVLESSVTSGAQVVSDVKYLKDDKVTETDIKTELGKEFYISIPASVDATKLNFKISGYFFVTQTTYYSVENPNTTNQPVVLVQKEKVPFEETLENKLFDLALRKFISAKNGTPLTGDDSREPQISNEEIEALKNNEKKTADKVHTKDPVPVKTGDKIIYTIRIYNEGELSGYAEEVTDYLPAGLKLVPNEESPEINKKYGWVASEDGKTIKTTYLKDTLLKAFNGTKLDYADLQIECEVIATQSTDDQILKNIAEITKDSDENRHDVEDRDSIPGNVDKEKYKTENKSQQDDDDFEDLVLKGEYFDLSLRKFITTVESGENTKSYNRVPTVVPKDLNSGKSTTATYNHYKNPIGVSEGDIVTYTIRVYNEGQLDGYVTKITDHLPQQLEFLKDDELNVKYGWEISSDGRTVSTDITSPKTEDHPASRDEIYKDRRTDDDKVLLEKFDGKSTLDYIDVQIRCKVKSGIDLYEKITNIAEITDYVAKDDVDQSEKTIIDRDSTSDSLTKDNSKPADKVPNDNLPSDEDLPEYKDEQIERGDSYIPGQQDDDDFEKLVLRRFDLALRKFITGVNDEAITNRAPVFNRVSDREYTYTHPKDPVEVANGNIVIYTLRIFNEGNVAGYASKVKDDLPDGLEFLPDHEINQEYKWLMYTADGEETESVEEAEYIETDYLSKENEQEDGENLIEAFTPSMTMPDYKDLKIAFKVVEPNTSDRILVNTAEITDDTDEDGNPVEDVDSTPDNDDEDEDDIDKEYVKVKYFDLSLKKWVSESIVTYNGKTTVTKTGHTGDENPEPPAKVELKAKELSKTTVKFKFVIKVTNEGEIAGYAKEVIDYIPQGLVFNKADNPLWREEDGKVLTDQLKDTLLQPGESATVEIILTWVNNKNNLGEKVNWAEIYKDENEYNSPDIDSTPGNDKKGEDDIDEAPVILSVKTGSAPTYITLALVSITILSSGVILIKKFVL